MDKFIWWDVYGSLTKNTNAWTTLDSILMIFSGSSVSRDISIQDEDLYESIYEVIRPPSESDFEEMEGNSNGNGQTQKQKKVTLFSFKARAQCYKTFMAVIYEYS